MSKCALLFFAVMIIQSCRSSEKNNEQIKKCFADYKKAIVNRQGTLGVACVSSESINYYSTTLHKVKEFDSTEIEKERPIDKYSILKIRQNVPYDSILHFDGKSLLVYLINHGSAGSVGISEDEIGNIQITNDVANVQQIMDGKSVAIPLKFYKENDGWKISTFSPYQYEINNRLLEQLILKSKLSENDYILNYVKKLSGANIKNNIWKPLLK